jgi:hypothetical protein
MGRLHDIRLRSNQFCNNINAKIEEAILFAENQVLNLNREQMKERQVDAFDKNLPEYSSHWKSIKGLTYFNLLDTGSFQNKLFMTVKYPKFLISSKDKKLVKLLNRVGDRMFGIAPTNQPEAKKITLKSFTQLYKSQVLK